MPEYRRSKFTGGSYFFTLVTYNRLPIFTNPDARSLLHSAFETVQKIKPFTIDAICLLPEHLHCIWTLPEGDADYSTRWKEVKRLFTHGYLETIGPGEQRNASRIKREEAAIWQRRFWEHTLRDEVDLNHHLDYIHYNPVKHGLVQRVCDWEWSSFHRYVRMGLYTSDWGAEDEEFRKMELE